MSPLDEAFHDWADAEGGCSAYEAFKRGWEAAQAHEHEEHQATIDSLARFWQLRVESAEAERNAVMLRLASAEYERTAFKRQRDELARAFMEAKGQV